MSILELKNVTKTINNGPKEQKTLLDAVNLTIRPGDFITVLGGNGAGKSTLFNSISGTLDVTQGQILLGGTDITALSEEKRTKWRGKE